MGIVGSNVDGRWVTLDFNSTNANIETFRLGTTVLPINHRPWFDGRYFWVSNVNAGNIKQYDYTRSSSMTQIGAIASGFTDVGIWGNGGYLWNITSTGTVTQFDISSGTPVGSFSLAVSVYRGLTGQGRTFWTHDVTGGTIIQFNEAGNIIGSFTAPSNTYDLHHDNRFLFINTGLAGTAATVRQYDPNSGTELGGHTYIGTLGASDSAAGICGDGRFLYATWIDVTPFP